MQADEREETITDAGELSDVSYLDPGEVRPIHILCFAKMILAAIAIMYTMASVMELVQPENAVFESCKLILPPLATLVIGYYFGTIRS